MHDTALSDNAANLCDPHRLARKDDQLSKETRV